MKRRATLANFYSCIKWGYASPEIPIEMIPKEFFEAKKFWAKKTDRTLVKAVQLIRPYIRCYFYGSACHADIKKIFAQDMERLEASSIDVYGLDFSTTNLPAVKACATFNDVKLKKSITQEGLQKWQDENDALDWCVSFEWDIEGADDDYNIRCWSHSGLDFGLLE